MRLGSLIMAVFGLAVAGGSAYMARGIVEAQSAAVQREAPAVVDVIVAGRDIAFGQPIESQMLTTISWPAEAVPNGTFSDYSQLLPAAGNEPRRAKRAIAQGELILTNKISDFGEKVTIVQTLKPNHRAMAIKVDAVTAVGGFVTPGDAVDIVLTQGRDENLRAVTILQNVRIIGVDQAANENSDEPKVARTVTVEVTPEQGQTLALAQQAGRLSLSLRNTTSADAPADKPLESIRLSDVMRDLSPVPEDEPKRAIKVRRGTDVSVEEQN